MTTHPDPWHVSEAGFPANGTPAEKFRFCLNYATLAPSGHNSQPWLFKIKPKEVDLLADRTRALPVVDPDDRELLISCGCALYNFRLALRYFGMSDLVDLLPDEENEDHVATVRMGGPHQATETEKKLFQAIPHRRTNRHRFEERDVPEELLAELSAAAEEEGAWLQVVRGDARLTVADLIAEGDQRQMTDRRFRRELAAWIHPNRTVSRDGMPAYAPGLSDIVESGGPFVLRTFEMGNTMAAIDHRIAMGSPALAVLGTEGDTPLDWINAGQALSRVLLRGQAESIYASYLNQPIEVPALRPLLSSTVGRIGFPQLLLRMGYGTEVRPTPRRAVEEIVI